MVFGLFKKNTTTFKNRVTEFWDWFPTVADKYYQAIEAGRAKELVPEMSKKAKQTLPELSWVFGAGKNEGHSFTVSGEGIVAKQLLAEYWHSRAPVIKGWTFHGSRQPSPPSSLKEMAIGISANENLDASELMFKTTVNNEEQLLDVVAWHPAFEKIPKDHHYQVLFLLLDEALGEFGTQTWLGNIEVAPIQGKENVRSLVDLPKFIEEVNRYHQWEKLPPLESYTVYEIPEQTNRPRGDTIVGSSCIPDIVSAYLEGRGRLRDNPLKGTGAEFAYVAIHGSVFPDDQQSEVRSNIEDALSEALSRELSGRTLGGAFGLNESYIDLILFDGEESKQIVLSTLEQLQLKGKSRLEMMS